jgi:hypothetical protein
LESESQLRQGARWIRMQDTAEYYRARECAERAAAKSASCPEARRAHQELAQAYAKLVQQREAHQVSLCRSR